MTILLWNADDPAIRIVWLAGEGEGAWTCAAFRGPSNELPGAKAYRRAIPVRSATPSPLTFAESRCLNRASLANRGNRVVALPTLFAAVLSRLRGVFSLRQALNDRTLHAHSASRMLQAYNAAYPHAKKEQGCVNPATVRVV